MKGILIIFEDIVGGDLFVGIAGAIGMCIAGIFLLSTVVGWPLLIKYCIEDGEYLFFGFLIFQVLLSALLSKPGMLFGSLPITSVVLGALPNMLLYGVDFWACLYCIGFALMGLGLAVIPYGIISCFE